MPAPLRVPGIATMPLWPQPQPPPWPPWARPQLPSAHPRPPWPPVLHVSQPPPPQLSQPPQESQPQPVSQQPPHGSQQPQGFSQQQKIFSRQQQPVLLATAVAANIANMRRFMGREILFSELHGVTRPQGPILAVAQLSPPS